MSEPVTAEERRAAHRRGHSLPMHLRAREDAQVANALSVGDGERKSVAQLVDGQLLTVDGDEIVCTPGGGGGGTVTVGVGLTGDGSAEDPVAVAAGGIGPTEIGVSGAGQTVRVNAAGTELEGIWSASQWVASDIPASTTPALVMTINLPSAGTYRISGNLLAQAGTISSTPKILTFTFAHAGVTGCQIGWAFGPTITTAGGYGYGTSFATALPAMIFATSQSDGFSSVAFWGEITVSAGGNLTLTAQTSGQTATVKPGCNVRLEKLA